MNGLETEDFDDGAPAREDEREQRCLPERWRFARPYRVLLARALRRSAARRTSTGFRANRFWFFASRTSSAGRRIWPNGCTGSSGSTSRPADATARRRSIRLRNADDDMPDEVARARFSPATRSRTAAWRRCSAPNSSCGSADADPTVSGSDRVGGDGLRRLAWAEGLTCICPQRCWTRCGVDAARAQPAATLELSRQRRRDRARTRPRRLRLRRAFTEQPPGERTAAVSYQLVPGWARALVASAIGRWNRGARRSVGGLPGVAARPERRFAGRSRAASTRPRPRRGRAPVIVTHDIDSPEGLTNLVTHVPAARGSRRRAIHQLRRALRVAHRPRAASAKCARAAIDVGVHGYDHSNRTPFAGDAERRRRLDAAGRFAERYAATRLSRAVAAADASVAARSRVALSLRQQHPDLRRAVSDAEQRLRDARGRLSSKASPSSRSGCLATAACASSATRQTRSSVSGSTARPRSRDLAASWCC